MTELYKMQCSIRDGLDVNACPVFTFAVGIVARGESVSVGRDSQLVCG